MSTGATVLGVDGCRGGWVAVALRDGRFASAHHATGLDGLLAAVDAVAVAVDIPVGLVDTGWREADVAARKLLGPRASTLFLTPPRAAFAEPTHAQASARCRALTGNGFSIQAWGLRPKVLEAERVCDEQPGRLSEVHPELSFTAMGLPAGCGPKKSWRGHRARLRTLAAAGIELPDDPGAAGAVPVDDLVDAAAAAWSAARIARGEAVSAPTQPQRNERGQPIAIWY